MSNYSTSDEETFGCLSEDLKDILPLLNNNNINKRETLSESFSCSLETSSSSFGKRKREKSPPPLDSIVPTPPQPPPPPVVVLPPPPPPPPPIWQPKGLRKLEKVLTENADSLARVITDNADSLAISATTTLNQIKNPNFWKHKTWCFGSVLNCSEDRQPEKRSKFSNFPIIKANEKTEENGTPALKVMGKYDPLEKDNVGFKLLQKMGWSTTKGLGKNENGILEPLEIQYNKSTHGLGVLKKEKKLANLVHHCEICNTNVSDSAWQAHINGKKHRKNQESRTNIHCKVCDITLDINTWASHIGGKKHAKRLHLQEQPQPPLPPSVVAAGASAAAGETNSSTPVVSPTSKIPTGNNNNRDPTALPSLPHHPNYIPAPPPFMVNENPNPPNPPPLLNYLHPSVIRLLQGHLPFDN